MLLCGQQVEEEITDFEVTTYTRALLQEVARC